MKITVTDPLLSYEGKPLTEKDENGKDVQVTYRDIFVRALNGVAPNEQIGAETKAKLYLLIGKLYKDKEISLTVDEAALIKERVGLLFNALVYGRVSEVLDDHQRCRRRRKLTTALTTTGCSTTFPCRCPLSGLSWAIRNPPLIGRREVETLYSLPGWFRFFSISVPGRALPSYVEQLTSSFILKRCCRCAVPIRL